ncbi:MAG TPA: TolC family protein [Candidatus Rifleibacterium sp.]|nr:TolC family protein [Candidatus Rifleibacterium sp.]
MKISERYYWLIAIVVFLFTQMGIVMAEDASLAAAAKPGPAVAIAAEEVEETEETEEVEPPEEDACQDFGVFNIFENSGASLTLSLDHAISSALSQNIALKVEKIGPELARTVVEKERARFDTAVSAEFSGSERIGKTIFQQGNMGENVTNRTDAGIVFEKLSTTGTRSALDVTFGRSRSARSDNLFSTRLGITLTHPLRRGGGRDVNLVSFKKAGLDLEWSEYELKGFILNFVAQVEKQYWEYYLSLRQLEIVRESLQLAKQQRDETRKRIEAGSIAESEEAAADAEVALRAEDLINAESAAVEMAISLLRSVNPDSDNFWKTRPELLDEPVLTRPERLSLEEHIAVAVEMRPELQQTRLLLSRDELDIVASRNGMLPKLDFFMNLGKTGYSTSFSGSNPRPGEEGSYDISAGFTYDLTRGRRAARADLARAKASAGMRREALNNLEQLVKEDVIKAYLEVERTLQQLTATAATSQKQLEKLRVEEVKFNVGKTTAFQVAQAQRDLTAARIAEARAAVGYTASIIDLLRADGSLLERNGILSAEKK